MASGDHVGGFEKKLRALNEGFSKEFPASDEVVLFGGQKRTIEAVVQELQRVEAMLEAVHRTHRAFRQAVADRRRAAKSHRTVYEDAVFLLKHHLGRENPRLRAFGIELPKARRQLTTEAKAIARAKAAATRQARGILGTRQRQALAREREPTLQVLGSVGQPLVRAEEMGIEAAPQPVREEEASGLE